MFAGDTVADWLVSLGVFEDRLQPEERRQLDEDAYLIRPHHIAGDLLDRLRRDRGRCDRGALDRCCGDPTVLAAAHQILGNEFGIDAVTYQPPRGAGAPTPRPAGCTAMIGAGEELTAVWCLDDLTRTNGAIQLTPAAHLRQAEEVSVTAPAGSLIVFDGRLRTDQPSDSPALPQPTAHPPGMLIVAYTRTGSTTILRRARDLSSNS